MTRRRPASASQRPRVFVYSALVNVWRAAFVSTCLLSACSRGSAATSAPPDAEALPDLSSGFGPAEAIVKTFFAAAESSDCATLAKILIVPDGGVLTAEGCESITHDFTESKAHLIRFLDVKSDGRDKHVVLVTSEVEFQSKKYGNLHQWVIRAEWRGGAWKVRF